ncbi:MAG: M48 family metalloprotease [Thiohalomonadales bacterium]
MRRVFSFHTTVSFFAVFVWLYLSPVQADQLPDMGSSDSRLMTLEQERQMGREFMRSVRMQLPLVSDPIATRYVSALGDELSSQLSQIDYQFTFFIVKDNTVNAFAGPGGYIGVHTGLIMAAKNEGELASVISHEIAHVSQRHLLRRFEKQSNMTLTTLAAMLAAILLGQSNSNVGSAILTSALANNTQSQLNFSRANEKEADYVGIDLLAKAGYDPRNMGSFFETLLAKNRVNGAEIPEFILTHPLTTSRISDAKNRAMQYRRVTASNKDPDRFGLIQARLAAPPLLYDDQQAISSPISNFVPKGKLAEPYWRILQLIANNKLNQANMLLTTLINLDRPRIIYSVTRAEIATKTKNYDAANDILAKALSNNPGNQAITELYAKTLLLNNNAEAAYKLLRVHIDNGYDQPALYKMLSDSARETGRLGAAYEAFAEYHYRLGHIFLALEHFKTALSIEKDQPSQTLRLNTRLKQIKHEIFIMHQKQAEDTE